MSFRRTVTHSEVFDSKSVAVWRIIVDWAAIAEWMPRGLIRSLEMEGSGVGAVRHLVTRDGIRIAERLDRADEEQRRLELSILDPLPWSMLSYRAAAQLDDLGPGTCRLRWEGCFELPKGGAAADELGVSLGKSYRAMFAGIRQQLAVTRSGSVSPRA